MRGLAFLEYGAILGGVIAMIAGHLFAASKALHLGVFLVGVGLALGGMESLFTRQISFRFSADAGEGYAGTPAVIWGLMALLVGSITIAAAYLLTQGLGSAAWEHLVRRPGPALAAGGLLLTGAGALLMFNRRGRSGLWRTLLVRLPRIVAGLTLAAAGLAAIGVGIWDWLEPRTFDRLWRALPGMLHFPWNR